MLPPQEIREVTLKDYWEVITKRWGILLSFIIILSGLAAFYSFTSPKVYRVNSSIAIESAKPEITERIEDIYQSEKKSAEYFQTQLNILQSRSMGERVIKSLELYKEPTFRDAGDSTGKLLSMVTVKAMRQSNIAVISVVGKDALHYEGLYPGLMDGPCCGADGNGAAQALAEDDDPLFCSGKGECLFNCRLAIQVGPLDRDPSPGFSVATVVKDEYGKGKIVVEWISGLQGKTVGLDTAPLIYFIEENPTYLEATKLFFEAMVYSCY